MASALWVFFLLRAIYTVAYLAMDAVLPGSWLSSYVAIFCANSILCLIFFLFSHFGRGPKLGEGTLSIGSHQPRFITAFAAAGIFVAFIAILGIFYSSGHDPTTIAGPAERILFVVLIPICEELLFRGYLRELIWRICQSSWSGWAASGVFVACHMFPFFESTSFTVGLIPWGVVILSATCELTRYLGYPLGLPITIHMIANGSVYYFVLVAPEFLRQWPFLFSVL